MLSPLQKLKELEYLVGNTPMIEITFKLDGKIRKVFAKLEYYNFSGSIKDRMALMSLKRAYQTGALKQGDTIVETTSGNTGIAICSQGSYLGHKIVIFMPDWMSAERKAMMKSFGAELVLVSREEGGFLGCLERTENLVKSGDNFYCPEQFANQFNVEAHYTSTGPEILKQMDKFGEEIHGVVAGVGTGGTIMGIGGYLRSVNPKIKVYPMEPESSPTLTTGYRVGVHRIAGISDEFIPAIMDLKACDEVIQVDDGDGIIMAQKLSRELGLGVGISSGANFLAAIMAADKIGEGANVVTLFSDDNKKYLSTDYAKEEPIKENFISTRIELLGFKTVVI
ncbi:MAG: cysteine synthase family protein [Defluviitaleaceae bacterium]|nr:cysteine synthase family protein [Defluviitaleaceae bacterium]